MSPTVLSLLILGFVLLGLLALLGVLALHLTRMTETSSQRLLDFQERATTSLNSQIAESRKTLLSLSETQLRRFVQPLLSQQEILVNRMIAKDAVTVQALDVRSVSQTHPLVASEYVAQDDEAEANRYEEMVSVDELRQDFIDSGLPNVSP